jgi:hypothetical protein
MPGSSSGGRVVSASSDAQQMVVRHRKKPARSAERRPESRRQHCDRLRSLQGSRSHGRRRSHPASLAARHSRLRRRRSVLRELHTEHVGALTEADPLIVEQLRGHRARTRCLVVGRPRLELGTCGLKKAPLFLLRFSESVWAGQVARRRRERTHQTRRDGVDERVRCQPGVSTTLTILRKEPNGRWVMARDANLLPAEPEHPP